jgi:hypothetical protein
VTACLTNTGRGENGASHVQRVVCEFVLLVPPDRYTSAIYRDHRDSELMAPLTILFVIVNSGAILVWRRYHSYRKTLYGYVPESVLDGESNRLPSVSPALLLVRLQI